MSLIACWTVMYSWFIRMPKSLRWDHPVHKAVRARGNTNEVVVFQRAVGEARVSNLLETVAGPRWRP